MIAEAVNVFQRYSIVSGKVNIPMKKTSPKILISEKRTKITINAV